MKDYEIEDLMEKALTMASGIISRVYYDEKINNISAATLAIKIFDEIKESNELSKL